MFELSLKDTLSCGQCFRFSNNENVWTVIAGVDENVRTLSLSQDEICKIEQDSFWSDYFDLQTDYESLKQQFSKKDDVLKTACEFAPGIRILNQNKWEALCSFVISQNNNIKRIMGIVQRMSEQFGKQNSRGVYGFPSSRTIAGLSEEQLRQIGLGFRASYVLNTARAVEDGLLESLELLDVTDARNELMKIKGVGSKVADCALLFGCHRLECFPMDVWMKRVMTDYFPGKDGKYFGPYAGVAQQYLFHWIRNSKEQI